MRLARCIPVLLLLFAPRVARAQASPQQTIGGGCNEQCVAHTTSTGDPDGWGCVIGGVGTNCVATFTSCSLNYRCWLSSVSTSSGEILAAGKICELGREIAAGGGRGPANPAPHDSGPLALDGQIAIR